MPWSHADFREQTATQTLEASDDEISSFSEADEAISSFSEANEACEINSASEGGTNGASEINSASEGEANETSETNGDRFRGMALPLVLLALGKGKAKGKSKATDDDKAKDDKATDDKATEYDMSKAIIEFVSRGGVEDLRKLLGEGRGGTNCKKRRMGGS